MGYDLHITRASHWTESESAPITLPEWMEYIKNDPEMRLEEVAVARVKGKPGVEYRSKGLAVWTAYSGRDPRGDMAWFDYRRGRIVVKNPDEAIRAKMKKIAAAFGANVVGDDGERY